MHSKNIFDAAKAYLAERSAGVGIDPYDLKM
jgi:hypothetical protein